ncbi:MAG: hypothetical protein PVF83_05435 [Anaerolineales bacterium]|jgi:hypothetical protein
MKNKVVFFIISALIIVLSSCSTSENLSKTPVVQSTTYPSPSIMEYFPLQEGAYWMYEGTVKWTKPNSSDIVEEEIIWKMEVEKVFQRNDVFGYEMLGAPWDLAWYEVGKQPNEYGIIQAGGKFFRTSIDSVWRLWDESDALIALVNEDEVFLEVPLTMGKKFCGANSITRSDGRYCWNVQEEKQVELNVKGIDPDRTMTEFTIAQYTGPDQSIFNFVPGVGITRYQYVHHGTVSEVDIRLVEFHLEE